MSTIHPTHTCFDDVLDHQVAVAQADPEACARQWIVHGICLLPEGPHAGEPFAHAWVEDDAGLGTVSQSGLFDDGRKVWFTVARPEWYVRMRVQARTRYTFEQARILNWQHEHYGPWVAAYRALCGRDRMAAP